MKSRSTSRVTAPPVCLTIAPTPPPSTAPAAPANADAARRRPTTGALIRKPYLVAGSAIATAAITTAVPTMPMTAPATNMARNCASAAHTRRGVVRNVGMTVPCPYSRAAAIAANRPAPIMALKLKAISERCSSAVEMKGLQPSASFP